MYIRIVFPAMLPISNVTQTNCVNSGSLESCRLFSGQCGEVGERVRFGFHELGLNRKVLTGIGLTKYGRNVSYKHHLPKALASQDVASVRTTEKVGSYRFWTENGGQLKIVVKRRSDKYIVCVEIVSLQPCEEVGELVMSWGLFRSDSTSFMMLDVSKQITVETPFVKDSLGKLAVEIDIDASLAPVYFSTLLKSQQGSNGETLDIRSRRKTNFVVPVGFSSGHPFPMGLSFLENGSINFSFFARNVEGVVLCLYADNKGKDPSLEIDLDSYVNRSGDIWHVLLDGSVSFVSYGYRCKDGSESKETQVLLDPYAKVIEDFQLGLPRKCLGKVCQEPTFDWGGDSRPSIPEEKLIVYKMEVGGFTKDKTSKLSGKIAGSFTGITEKLHHFRDLGVNAILLEPIFPFDEQKGPYYPWHFFSPGSKSSSGDSRNVAKSIKDMVKKLHASGIEVLLEVVFTHTSEVAALRQIDNASYYQHNTALNCNYPVVSQMILESLRHWVIEYHIDGFVFINSSSLTKGSKGEFLTRPPLVEAIAFDPLLSKVKIIADSWDPSGLATKDVKFPHWKRWAEMNAKFCVDVRNFLRGRGPISNLATRLCGSGDVFLPGRGPGFSFNYITRNVGFTLVDLVSFSTSDVALSESSWNCGEEGPTNKTVVLETRLKQIRNYLFILFVSLGIPVITMGDECGHSTGGLLEYSDRNLDWSTLKSGFGIQVTQFISFLSSLKVRRSDLLQRSSFLSEENIEWHGPNQSPPMWDDPSCKFLAVTLKADEESAKLASDSPFGYGDLFIAFNSADHPQEVTLPPSTVDATWVCLVDTSLPYPGFFTMDGVPLEAEELTYEMKSHSCILFESRSSG